MTNGITILSSRKNYAWISMEEIISWIEGSWSGWAESRNLPCQVIMAESSQLPMLARAVMRSDLIVVTCFNPSVAGILRALRKQLGIRTPWIYYLHGLGSLGCWPLFRWGIGDLLTSHDLFIGSCQRDRDQFQLVFKNIECRIIPFSLEIKREIPRRMSDGMIRLAYIGRITSQKNLHTLLAALAKVKIPFEMHFFGKEDFYGSPLIGQRETGYLDYLEELTETFGIKGKVTFHGFMKREEIETLMDSALWTFFAPSIHSDENFGMAAFRCLLNGHKVLLSDWGGHADYAKNFPSQVKLVAVRESEIGPYIDVHDLIKAIEEFTLVTPGRLSGEVPEAYQRSRMEREYDEVMKLMRSRPEIGDPVEVKPVLKEIQDRREAFLKTDTKPEGIRIYRDYQDELLKRFFRAYGMRSLPQTGTGESFPWVMKGDASYCVQDPHRGSFTLPLNSELRGLGLSY